MFSVRVSTWHLDILLFIGGSSSSACRSFHDRQDRYCHKNGWLVTSTLGWARSILHTLVGLVPRHRFPWPCRWMSSSLAARMYSTTGSQNTPQVMKPYTTVPCASRVYHAHRLQTKNRRTERGCTICLNLLYRKVLGTKRCHGTIEMRPTGLFKRSD